MGFAERLEVKGENYKGKNLKERSVPLAEITSFGINKTLQK